MHLDRKNNTAIAESYFSFNSLNEYIRRIVNIYSGAEVDRSYWLTQREQDFFVAMAYHALHNIENPTSDEAIQIYKKYFNPTTEKANISNYVSRICKKKWANYDSNEKVIKLNPILDGLNAGSDRFDFKIRLDYSDENPID